MGKITLKAYAKINLSIDVLGKRPDGYHEVDMIMQQVDLWDQVTVWTKMPRAGHVNKRSWQVVTGKAVAGEAEGFESAERRGEKECRGNDNISDWAEDSIHLYTNRMDLPTDRSNLAFRAAELMGERYRERMLFRAALQAAKALVPVQAVEFCVPAVEIRLEKRIPMAAGLAGGSADGAAVLHALNRLWRLSLSLDELMELGGKLGADVPFCVMGQAALNRELGFAEVEGKSEDGQIGPAAGNRGRIGAAARNRESSLPGTCARATGVGKTVAPLPPISAWIILSRPDVFVSTAEIFSKLDLSEIKERPNTEILIRGLMEKDLDKVTANMGNVLEKVSVKEYPAIIKVKQKMELAGGASKVMMTGSGPVVFGIFRELSEARKAYEEMKSLYPETFLVKALS